MKFNPLGYYVETFSTIDDLTLILCYCKGLALVSDRLTLSTIDTFISPSICLAALTALS